MDSADCWFELAGERNLPVALKPTTFPWGHRMMRLLDPDGITVSLFEVVSPAY